MLIPEKDKANQHLGKLEFHIRQIWQDVDQKEKLIHEIRSYEEMPFLEQTFHTLDSRNITGFRG
ncbi:hypothetical protein KUV50_16805 [Membranicola marinus]|uniref:Uncharacterized protein n=1 Tax=Membranihabitans marinus TaxID=1227546 RepID=A0A953LCS6_9BACT|nr:hypothetical protein [Membranihabitans marinus]MBY5959816.1 hypothetical protein [Membranihabitans marinus]